MQHPFDKRENVKVASCSESAPVIDAIRVAKGVVIVSIVLILLNLVGAAGSF